MKKPTCNFVFSINYCGFLENEFWEMVEIFYLAAFSFQKAFLKIGKEASSSFACSLKD